MTTRPRRRSRARWNRSRDSDFIDALREFLGLDPLFNPRRTNEERFACLQHPIPARWNKWDGD